MHRSVNKKTQLMQCYFISTHRRASVEEKTRETGHTMVFAGENACVRTNVCLSAHTNLDLHICPGVLQEQKLQTKTRRQTERR